MFNENSFGTEKEKSSVSTSRSLIDLEMETPESDEEEPQEQETNTESTDDSTPVPRRSSRVSKPTDFYGTWVHATVQGNKEPTTVQEAMSSLDQKLWKEAMKKEMESIETTKCGD